MDFQSEKVKLVYIDYSWIQRQFRLLQCSLSIFRSLSHGGSLTLYSSLWNILILHLLIIWASTWVPVPSDTLSDFLWVVVAKVILFRGLPHINEARKVAAMHLMRWQQLSLDIFGFPSFLYVHEACSYHCSFLEGHSNYWNTYLSCIRHIRGGIPPRTTFHSFLTHEILNWDPK